ncbi:MAG: redox-regulated ATPase YchF [Candidatus Pacearchaeota archaeon]
MLIGLVGKPSVGKSTFFKAATLSEVEIASYPFTTIKANHGIGYVKLDCIDKELNTQCTPAKGFCIEHNRFVPIEIMDVAGLVPGSSQGKGLGNKFLDDLRQADVFIHIIDISGETDMEGKPTEGHNPLEDIKFLEKELDLWYLGILMRVWKSFSKKAEIEDTNFAAAVTKQFSGLKIKEEQVKEVLSKMESSERPSRWGEDILMDFASALRKKSKPMIIAANKIDKKNSESNLKKIKEAMQDLEVIPCSADSELALREASKLGLIDYLPGSENFEIKAELSKGQKEALDKIKANVLEIYGNTGMQEILNKAIFDLLRYIAIFPASANRLKDSKGRTLPDCFLLPKGSTALDFAYFLHTDFGKNFIKAIDAKTKKAIGKEHELKHRDALEIVSR